MIEMIRPPHTEGHLDIWTLVLFDETNRTVKLQSLPCRVILSTKTSVQNVPNSFRMRRPALSTPAAYNIYCTRCTQLYAWDPLTWMAGKKREGGGGPSQLDSSPLKVLSEDAKWVLAPRRVVVGVFVGGEVGGSKRVMI